MIIKCFIWFLAFLLTYASYGSTFRVNVNAETIEKESSSSLFDRDLLTEFGVGYNINKNTEIDSYLIKHKSSIGYKVSIEEKTKSSLISPFVRFDISYIDHLSNVDYQLGASFDIIPFVSPFIEVGNFFSSEDEENTFGIYFPLFKRKVLLGISYTYNSFHHYNYLKIRSSYLFG